MYQLDRNMSIHRYMERLSKCGRQQRHNIVLFGIVGVILFLIFTKQEEHDVSLKSDETTSERTPAITTHQTPPEKAVSTVANIFNVSNMLQNTVKELETDGWIAPVGSAEVKRRLQRMNSGMLRKTTASFVETKPSGPVLLNADRWKGRTTFYCISLHKSAILLLA